jgi:hypothetical protein
MLSLIYFRDWMCLRIVCIVGSWRIRYSECWDRIKMSGLSWGSCWNMLKLTGVSYNDLIDYNLVKITASYFKARYIIKIYFYIYYQHY